MKRLLDSKRILAALLMGVILGAAKPVFSGALIHASVTGRVWGNIQRSHGQIVRFTLRDNGWPNALHDIVIRPHTRIYHNGSSREKLSPNVLRVGQQVRAQGGVTTFGNRIVADRVILLSR